MTKRVLAAAFAAALLAAGGVIGVTAANATSTPTVIATTSVSNHPDTTSASGSACLASENGPQWATDAYTATFVAVPDGANHWHVVISDTGTFTGFADPTTCADEASTGTFTGEYSFEVTSDSNPVASGLHSSYGSATDSTTAMVRDLFDNSSAVISNGDYIFQYQGGNYTQDTVGAYGDVTASVVQFPVPAELTSASSTNTVTASWDAVPGFNAANGDVYHLRLENAHTGQILIWVNTTDPTQVFKGLTPGTHYGWDVVVIAGSKDTEHTTGPWSAWQSVFTPAG